MTDIAPQPEPEVRRSPDLQVGGSGGRRSASRTFWRWPRRIIGVLLAVIAAALITGVSIDLGPSLRKVAEKQATNFMKRPMHIGTLKARVNLGAFELDNIIIEGLHPGDRPFLKADKLTLYVPWWTIVTKKLIVEDVHMTGWSMTLEQFADGKTSLPKLTKDPNPNAKPSWFTTTVRLVHTDDGQFTYDDHGSPWSVVCRNLNVSVANANGEYRGIAWFNGGTVNIAKFQPMSADFNAGFIIDGKNGVVILNRIHMVTDGAVTNVTGAVDFKHFPEMTFNISDSHIHFPTMRNLFFHDATYEFEGDGVFKGVFHVFQGGRKLSGSFSSDHLGVQFHDWGTYRFQQLTGALTWTRNAFEVHDVRSAFYGGRMVQSYSLGPIGTPTPAIARWETAYNDVDLETFSDALKWPVLRLSGAFSGHNVLTWPNGRFHERHGDGDITSTPIGGVLLAQADLPPDTTPVARGVAALGPVASGRKSPATEPNAPLGALPVGGHMAYHWFPDYIDVDDSWVASPKTYIRLHGRTAYFGDSTIPFHLTSADWQESDRVLVAIMGAFHSQASAIEVGGQGTFDGALTRTFTNPRIAGAFVGRQMRAWGVTWGPMRGGAVIDNSYVDVSDVTIGGGDSVITTTGRYSMGFPRRDHGEELDARVSIKRWPAVELRTAFQLPDWPLEGAISSDLHVYGHYKYPDGFGNLRIDDGTAWGETFDRADAGLRLDASSVHVDGITMTKSAGSMTGAALINWNGTYSFTAQGQQIPVESMTRLSFPSAKLTGRMTFSAHGEGEFASPRYSVHGTVEDLFAGDEGIGRVTGDLTLANQELGISVEASSSRLVASGGGTLRVSPTYDADLTFRFTDTAIDPYLRMLAPGKFEFVTSDVNGSLHLKGDPSDWKKLSVDADVDSARLKIFDYPLENDGPIRFSFDGGTFRAGKGDFKLKGEETALQVWGDVAGSGGTSHITTQGSANLKVLQAFFPNLRSQGSAAIDATFEGDITQPTFSGQASITGGRVRYLGYEQLQGLDDLNGVLLFDKGGITLQGVHGTLGQGDIAFDGNIPFKGLLPSDFDLHARGEKMLLRYPKDFLSTVSADLSLTGPVSAPQLGGDVTVERTTYTRQFEGSAGLLSLIIPNADEAAMPNPGPDPNASAYPLTIDVRLRVPPTSFIDETDLRLSGHADLHVVGTPAHLSILGNLDIDSGRITVLGNNFTLTHGSLNFNDPTAVHPLLDFDAETPVHVPGQDYRVSLRFSGTVESPNVSCTSDPPLPTVDCLGLLLGQSADLSRAELRALGSPQDAELNFLRSAAGQVVAGAIVEKSGVGSVVQRVSGVDTVVTPLFSSDQSVQSLNATARVTFGKRISDRVYVTYSRALNASQYEVVLLEYDQSDRIQWIISRNEDRTFAIDFRVRYRF